MAKNTNKRNSPVKTGNAATVAAAVTKPPVKEQNAVTATKSNRQPWLAAAAIAILVWLFYSTSLNNLLTNWDDPGYIRDNPLIKDLSANGLKAIFSTPVMGNYHPLTILTYAIEYSFVRLDPWLYHLNSVLLHIVVTLLVFVFVNMLTKRIVAASVTAMLFGLHPMHVESVAWLAGRKDVVYATFYMAACIGWIKYLRATTNQKLWYAGVIVLFLCSLLAKPVAVTLPLALLAIDYFENRTWSWGLILEKIPHFAISVAFGIRSMIDQKAFGSLATQNVDYSPLERLALGGYAFVTYLWKAVLPLNLSCFYPYPPKVDNVLPAYTYLYTLAAIGLLAALWLARKKKAVVFGALFFLINIALLLQFIPVGGAIVADRYSYIPYLGLFFMAGWYISDLFQPEGNKSRGYMVAGITAVYSLFLGVQAHARCQAWYDTASLWRDAIEKQPLAPNAWNNLGFHYFNRFNESVDPQEKKICYDSALYLLSQATALDKTFANPVVSLGELQRGAGNFAEAKKYYYHALTLGDKEGKANAYLGLGITYAINRNFDSAGICFQNAATVKPYFPELHSNFGNFYDMMREMYAKAGNTMYAGRLADSAFRHYGLAIAQNPDMYAPYLNRGRMYWRLDRCADALKDYEAAVVLRPDLGEIYYARSFCMEKQGNKRAALQEVEKAISLGFRDINPQYYQMLKTQ
jgi:tetratricopeptide (TPR) repeat protein